MKKIAQKSLKIVDSIFWTDYSIKRYNRRIRFHDPDYHFAKNEIAFVHIPKTGGTTLHSLLDQNEPSRFVNLHMHRPISRWCKPTEYDYITVIRNPVERVWSYYQMILRSPRGFPYKRFARKGLECFLKHCWEARNMACRYYSGDVNHEPRETTVDVALDNLENFACVIDFESFHIDAVRFLQKHTIPVGTLPHNQKNSYAPYNQSDQRLICDYNAFDIKLFTQWKEQSKNSLST